MLLWQGIIAKNSKCVGIYLFQWKNEMIKEMSKMHIETVVNYGICLQYKKIEVERTQEQSRCVTKMLKGLTATKNYEKMYLDINKCFPSHVL